MLGALSGIEIVPLRDQMVLAIQIGAAAACGFAIGLERELAGKRAGMRTHMLVAVAAALAVGLGRVTSADGGGDATRVLHGVVTGVGFIGAGAILSRRRGPSGLTTAATILLVAVLGASCALGAPILAGVVTMIALLTLRGISAVEPVAARLFSRQRRSTVSALATRQTGLDAAEDWDAGSD